MRAGPFAVGAWIGVALCYVIAPAGYVPLGPWIVAILVSVVALAKDSRRG